MRGLHGRPGPAVYGIATGAWLVLALVIGVENHVFSAYRGRPVGWAQSLAYPLMFYAIWAALTPGIVWLGDRCPPGRRGPGRGYLVLHLLASAGVALLHTYAFVYLMPRVQPDTWRGVTTSQVLLNALLANFQSNVVFYWLLVGVTRLVSYYQRNRAREMQAARLEGRLARAELQVLKMQLQPHFLFNTLHAISALVHDNPEAADRMITRLADLLRLTLDGGGVQEVPLRHELEFVSRYLDIERIRLGDRLRVDERIDEAALDALVPSLFLQPIVENAIRHGIAPTAAGGTLVLQAQRDGDTLRLEVCDDGQGIDLARSTDGVGLSNTRLRLEQLYGSTQRFEITGQPGAGTRVTVILPYAHSHAHRR